MLAVALGMTAVLLLLLLANSAISGALCSLFTKKHAAAKLSCRDLQRVAVVAVQQPDGAVGPEHGTGWLGMLKRGGYFSTVAAPNLTVISLNVNYWVHMNSAAVAPAGDAEGRRMMPWLEAELVTAEAGGHAVHILGHQPPADKDMQPAWFDGCWPQHVALCERFERSIQGHFYGHIHVGKWTLTRACREGPAPPTQARERLRGDKGRHPVVLRRRQLQAAGQRVQHLARRPLPARADGVGRGPRRRRGRGRVHGAGFTLYIHNTSSQIPREACFRTRTCSSKPASPGTTTRCYYAKWKDQPNTTSPTICNGAASTVLIPGPSLLWWWWWRGGTCTMPGRRSSTVVLASGVPVIKHKKKKKAAFIILL